MCFRNKNLWFSDIENIIFTNRTKMNAKEKLPKKERFLELQIIIQPEVVAFLENYEKLYCKNNMVNLISAIWFVLVIETTPSRYLKANKDSFTLDFHIFLKGLFENTLQIMNLCL